MNQLKKQLPKIKMKNKRKGENVKKFWKITSGIVYWAVFLTLLVSTVMVISTKASGGEPSLMGYQLKTVLSGSMEPTFKTGSLILVEQLDDTSNLKANDVITYKQDETNVVTHRIQEVIDQQGTTLFVTKGDNNENADTNPVLSENVVAKYTGITVPFVGYFLQYANSPYGTAVLLIIPGLLLLGYAAFTIRQAIKEIEGKMKNTASEAQTAEKIVS